MVKKSSKVVMLVIAVLVVVGLAQTVKPKSEPENVTIKVGDVSVTIPAGHEKEFRKGLNE